MYGIRDVLLTQERNDYHEHLSQAPFKLDCSMGSNPYGVWPGLTCPADLFADIAVYPPSDEPVQRGICKYFSDIADLKPENVLLTCGSIGSILTLNRMVLVPGKHILGVGPQFSAVVDDFVTYEAIYHPVYLKAENNYAFVVEDFLAAMRQYPGAYVYIDNPNNPTGQVIPLSATEQIVALARELDTFVVMDEAYGDYMDNEQSAIRLIDRYDNLAVVRTFAKGMGAAGIRLGYILAQPQIISAANKVNVPYSKNQVAECVACQLLESGWARQCVERVRENKPRMLAALKNIKAVVTDNGVSITMLYVDDDRINLCDLLEQVGIRAITGVGYAGIGQNMVRLNMHEDMDQLIECLRAADELVGQKS